MNLYAVPEKLQGLSVATKEATISVVESDLFQGFNALPNMTLSLIDSDTQRQFVARFNAHTLKLSGARPTWMTTTVNLTKAFVEELKKRKLELVGVNGNFPVLREVPRELSWLVADLRTVLGASAVAGRASLYSVKDYRIGHLALSCGAQVEIFRKPLPNMSAELTEHMRTAAKGKFTITNEHGVFAIYSPHFDFSKGIHDQQTLHTELYIEFVRHFPFLKGKVKIALFDTFEDKTIEEMIARRASAAQATA